MSAFSLRAALPPRHTPAASAWPTPPRVYSPFYPRRLTHPMAVPATATPHEGAPAVRAEAVSGAAIGARDTSSSADVIAQEVKKATRR